MQNFLYRARNIEGKMFVGVTEAEDKQDLRKKLRKSGYYVVSIKPYTKKRSIFSPYRQKVSLDTLILFTRQLASMLEAGMPILTALDTLWNSIDIPRMQLVISQLKNKLSAGSSLAAAINEFPDVFPTLYRSLVSVAEGGAGLTVILKKLVEYMEDQREFISRIKRATLYPVFVIVFALLVLILMLVLVVPTFQNVFSKLHVELPFITRMIIGVSIVMRSPVFWIILLGAAVLVFFTYRRMKSIPKFALMLEKAKFNLPVLGEIFYLASMERFTRSLSLLLGAGVEIVESLKLIQGIVMNKSLELALDSVLERIIQGVPISEALAETKKFPIMLITMVNLGEHTGRLDAVLQVAASHFADELDMRIHRFLTLLEPMLIIFVGGIVAVILFSIYFPIFSLWKSFPGMK